MRLGAALAEQHAIVVERRDETKPPTVRRA
jgi:hypothetical protein